MGGQGRHRPLPADTACAHAQASSLALQHLHCSLCVLGICLTTPSSALWQCTAASKGQYPFTACTVGALPSWESQTQPVGGNSRRCLAAGLAATQMAATAQGSSEMTDQVKLGRMFKSGALLPLVEALVTYQQVRSQLCLRASRPVAGDAGFAAHPANTSSRLVSLLPEFTVCTAL